MTEKRWLKTLLKDTETASVRMPWERGLRREAFIARRKSILAKLEVELRAEAA